MGTEEGDYLTVEEAARVSGMSLRTIRRWVRAGTVPSVTIEGTIRIPRKEFDAMVARRRRRCE